ncbi:hypothetical protein BDK51DRAFT_39837 [Blyttiomyces helicus]|uniref:Uncharacterized protein n=1 Tax=Blyttiomyces helicus TaxID=388810 RepID=A0A4P9W8D9_9FUNG|nr:hypothetical protein BDK51DRAFT_39837 [Blyttiomyces helicus]|eukprot:RKO88789.1 hypothetical protein BDK51DRAFT_39837 [Blyttiomyces helicus]
MFAGTGGGPWAVDEVDSIGDHKKRSTMCGIDARRTSARMSKRVRNAFLEDQPRRTPALVPPMGVQVPSRSGAGTASRARLPTSNLARRLIHHIDGPSITPLDAAHNRPSSTPNPPTRRQLPRVVPPSVFPLASHRSLSMLSFRLPLKAIVPGILLICIAAVVAPVSPEEHLATLHLPTRSPAQPPGCLCIVRRARLSPLQTVVARRSFAGPQARPSPLVPCPLESFPNLGLENQDLASSTIFLKNTQSTIDASAAKILSVRSSSPPPTPYSPPSVYLPLDPLPFATNSRWLWLPFPTPQLSVSNAYRQINELLQTYIDSLNLWGSLAGTQRAMTQEFLNLSSEISGPWVTDTFQTLKQNQIISGYPLRNIPALNPKNSKRTLLLLAVFLALDASLAESPGLSPAGPTPLVSASKSGSAQTFHTVGLTVGARKIEDLIVFSLLRCVKLLRITDMVSLHERGVGGGSTVTLLATQRFQMIDLFRQFLTWRIFSPHSVTDTMGVLGSPHVYTDGQSIYDFVEDASYQQLTAPNPERTTEGKFVISFGATPRGFFTWSYETIFYTNPSNPSFASYSCATTSEADAILMPFLQANIPSPRSVAAFFDTANGNLIAATVPGAIEGMGAASEGAPAPRQYQLDNSPAPKISQLGAFLLSQFKNYSNIGTNTSWSATLADGGEWYVAVAPITPDSFSTWAIVLAVPRNDFFSKIDQSITTSATVIIVLSLVGAMAISLFSLIFTIPLKRLLWMIGELTELNFSVLKDDQVDKRSYISEISKLEEAFAIMVKAFAVGIKKNREIAALRRNKTDSRKLAGGDAIKATYSGTRHQETGQGPSAPPRVDSSFISEGSNAEMPVGQLPMLDGSIFLSNSTMNQGSRGAVGVAAESFHPPQQPAPARTASHYPTSSAATGLMSIASRTSDPVEYSGFDHPDPGMSANSL